MKCPSNLYEIPISQVFLPALLLISESLTCLSVQRMNSSSQARLWLARGVGALRYLRGFSSPNAISVRLG